MFINAELSQLPFTDGRRSGRRIVNLAAALREEGATTSPVLLVDLSASGFRVETVQPLDPGAEVWLKIPSFEARRSRVVWAEGGQAGCEFESPLHDRDIAAIASPRPRTTPKNVFRRV